MTTKPKFSAVKIRRELASLRLTTAHAQVTKANAIAHLATYERSVHTSAELDLGALQEACNCLSWLIDHVQCINDRQVLPSGRQFLADALRQCVHTHREQSGV